MLRVEKRIKDKRSNVCFGPTEAIIEPHRDTETVAHRSKRTGKRSPRPEEDGLGARRKVDFLICADKGARTVVPDMRSLGPGMTRRLDYQLTLWSNSYSGSGWTGSNSTAWSNISQTGGPRVGAALGGWAGAPMCSSIRFLNVCFWPIPTIVAARLNGRFYCTADVRGFRRLARSYRFLKKSRRGHAEAQARRLPSLSPIGTAQAHNGDPLHAST